MISRGWAVAFLLAALNLASAQDTWRTKPPSQWTEQEALRVITASPWALPTKLKYGNYLVPQPGSNLPPAEMRTPQTGAPGLVEPASTLPPLRPETKPVPGLPSITIGTPPPADTDMPRRQDLPPPPTTGRVEALAVPRGSVIVLWDSALPVLEAKARLGIKSTENRLAPNAYVITVIGYPFPEDQKLDNEMLAGVRDSAYLQLEGKERIAAADVEVIRSGSVLIVRYFFPRRVAISTGSREVRFWMQIGLGDIAEARFKPKEMVWGRQLALSDYAAWQCRASGC